jgi:MoaA/NifB/PqqE/SkfB family radical SAM enzyme
MSSDTEFHQIQERLSETIYQTPGMLPSRYVYILTNQCNLRCDFCFQDKKPGKNPMTQEDWIHLTKQLPEYARVTLTGGEPLSFSGFENVFKYVAEIFNCNVITNGILLTSKNIDYMLSFPKFRVLSVSIDDIGDKLRGVSPKKWNHLEEMLKYFVKKKGENDIGQILDIKTTVVDENAEHLFETYKYLVEEIGVDTHAFQFLKGSPIQHSDQMFSFEDIKAKSSAPIYQKFEEIKKQLDMVREYNTKHNRVSFVHPKAILLESERPISDINYLNEKSHQGKKFSPCKFPWSSIHINWDGNIFPCLAVPIGNVKEKSLAEIIDGDESKKFREIIKDNGTVEACNRCGWLRQK